MVSSGRIIS